MKVITECKHLSDPPLILVVIELERNLFLSDFQSVDPVKSRW